MFSPANTSAISCDSSRRAFLQAGAMQFGIALAGANLSQTFDGITCAAEDAETKAKKFDGFIDAHVHVWTPDLEKYPLAEGFTREDMKPASFTPEELLKHAMPCGVGRIVLIQMSYYRFDNSYMLHTMQQHPGRFSGVAVIDESKQPADEMRKLKKAGVRGFRIVPGKRSADTWLDGEGMQAMWKCGAEEGLAMCCLINPNALPAVGRMCQKFPDTPVVIDHFARVGVTGEIRREELDALCRLAEHKNTHVKVSAFYALGKKQPPYLDLSPMIRRVYDSFGPQRLMWATDCPFQVNPGHTYLQSVELVRDRLDFLSAEDKEWLIKGTAEKVYFS